MDNFNLELTPKRKSILWNYNENGCAGIVALKTEKQGDLKKVFGDELPNLNIKSTDGLGMILNYSGTKIWEQCDGVTTIDEIATDFVEEFGISKEDAIEDIFAFLKYGDKVDILDLKWRSIL